MPASASGSRSRLRVLLVLLGLVVLATACASSGEPDDYDDAVEDNFMEACAEASENNDNVAAPADYCTCVYAWFEQTVPYEQFKSLDDTLRDQIEAEQINEVDDIAAIPDIGPQTLEIYRRCEADSSARPGPDDIPPPTTEAE